MAPFERFLLKTRLANAVISAGWDSSWWSDDRSWRT